MARWRQVFDEQTQKSEFVPIDGAARDRDAGAAIHGTIEPFISPVDGSYIGDRKALREHNKRNNVVHASEFEQPEYQKLRKDRERLYTGERTKEQIRRDRMEIHETIERLERQGR